MANAGQWGAALGGLGQGESDLADMLLKAKKQQSDNMAQQANARYQNTQSGLPPDAPGSIQVPQGNLLSQGIGNILKNLGIGHGNSQVQGNTNNQGGSAGQANATSAEPPQAGKPSAQGSTPQGNQDETANSVWQGNNPEIKKYMAQGMSFQQARDQRAADSNQSRSFNDPSNLNKQSNDALNNGLPRVRGVVTDLSAMMELRNAKNDPNTFNALAQNYVQRFPQLSAMLQAKNGQPMNDQDRKAIYNSLAATVASETHNILGSNAAVGPGESQQIINQNIPAWEDDDVRANGKLNTIVQTFLKPSLTAPLDAFQTSRRNQNGELIDPNQAQAEHTYKSFYKQVLGEEYAPKQPGLVRAHQSQPQGQPGNGGGVYTPQEIQQLRAVTSTDPRYGKIQQILSGIK